MGEIVCQRIMVAIDGTDEGRAAADYAIPLARRLSATLIVVGVVDASVCLDPQALLRSSHLLDVVECLRRAGIDKIVEEARQVGVAEVERHLVEGNPSVDLVDATSEYAADLIVVGSRRSSAIQRLLTGSIAEHLVRHATAPVLVVRSDPNRDHGSRKSLPLSGATRKAPVRSAGRSWHRPVLHLFPRSARKV
jgi:nucleotide-binding universal stress UspA family protein